MQTMRENNSYQRIALEFPLKMAVLAIVMTAVNCNLLLAQKIIDPNQIFAEQLITSTAGATGDLLIHVSYPKWVAKQTGYFPLRFRINPSKGLAFRNDGVVKIEVGDYRTTSGGGMKTVVEIPIKKGDTESIANILGNVSITNFLMIEAALNGRKLSGQKTFLYNAVAVEDIRSLELISSETAKLSRQKQQILSQMQEAGSWLGQGEILYGTYRQIYGDIVNLPTNWLYLNGIEQVSTQAADLEQLSAGGRACLNDYALGGGTLVISKVRSLEEIKKHFAIDEKRTLDSSISLKRSVSSRPSVLDLELSVDFLEGTIWDLFQRRCIAINQQPYLGATMGMGSQFQSSGSDLFQVVESLEAGGLEICKSYLDYQLWPVSSIASKFHDALELDVTEQEKPVDEFKGTLTLAHGFGIIHLDSKSRRDNQMVIDDSSNSFAATSTASRLNRPLRFANGIGDDFWCWLIPSVGRTPVIAFLAFVVLFVGIVVPALMFWCQRHKRRIWLVVAMPIMATTFTTALFAFGILKDGFGAKVRLRSIAFLDQAGEGMVWSRQAYFAASVPTEGISLHPDTQFAFMPANNEKPVCEHRDLGTEQRYFNAIPPRQQMQISITHPLRGLSVFRRDTQIDTVLNAPAIVNNMDTPWIAALFLDQDGGVYYAKDVHRNQPAEFVAMSTSDALGLLKKVYESEKLVPPDDAPSTDQMSLNQFFQDMFSYGYNRHNNRGVILEEEVWENEIGYTFPKNTQSKSVLASTYILFVEKAPYLESCIPAAIEGNSLHTIVGRWKK